MLTIPYANPGGISTNPALSGIGVDDTKVHRVIATITST